MQGLPVVLLFVALTFVSWGAYGPVLHHGTQAMGNDSLRAFVGVGLAYFIIAVVAPIMILRRQSEKGKWTVVGTSYSILAGAVGAIGALGVILALAYKGKPVYVMPLVFGFAPIVNTLVTAWMGKAFNDIKPIFIGGIVTAALGAGGVLAFKPTAVPHIAVQPSENSSRPIVPQPKESGAVDLPGDLVKTDELQSVAPTTESEPAREAPSPQALKALPPIVEATDSLPAKSQLPTNATEPVPQQQPASVSADSAAKASAPAVDPPAKQIPAIEIAPLPPAVVNPAPYNQDDRKNAPAKSASQLGPLNLQASKYVFLLAVETDSSSAAVLSTSSNSASGGSVLKIVLSIIMAAFCWGAYGPMLHQGQMRMGGSRLRPFICVGLAYFIIAVAVPLYLINSGTSTGSWSAGGLFWSIAAGAAGAIGALGIILAFNAGGKPFYVMPLVFGFAPVINTFITLTESGLWADVRPQFWISLAIVITGAITVLTNAPKPKQAHSPAPANP